MEDKLQFSLFGEKGIKAKWIMCVSARCGQLQGPHWLRAWAGEWPVFSLQAFIVF